MGSAATGRAGGEALLHVVGPGPLDATTAAALARVHEESATVAYAHVFDTPFPRAETLARWAGFAGRVALAHRGDDLVGFAAWHDDELDALYVLPGAAGAGVGSALVARAEGATRLWVLRENHRARAFYAARGWRPDGREREVYPGVAEVGYAR